MAIGQYPLYNPSHSGEVSGPSAWGTSVCGFVFHPLPLEYRSNVFKEMVDGGGTYGADTTNAVRTWRIVYTGLSVAQAAVLDAHYESAKNNLLGFNFRVPASRGDTLYSDVHYLAYEYPQHEQVDNQTRTVTLVKRPA
jgi:hypothetical protein